MHANVVFTSHHAENVFYRLGYLSMKAAKGWAKVVVRVQPCILDSTCYATPHFSDTSPMHLRSSSTYSDALHIRLHMLCNSAPPPASTPLHMLPPLVCLFVCLPLSLVHVLLVCLFVSPSRLFLLIGGQWTSAKSNCTCSIRRGLSRRLRSSLLLNSSPSTSRDHPLSTYHESPEPHQFQC